MLSRLWSGWTDSTRGEKTAIVLLAPFALGSGFLVGLIGAIYILTALPVSGA